MRDAFIAKLTELAADNPRIALITGDLGFGVLTDFAKDYPNQFINAGVAEQNMTALACGMAQRILQESIAYAQVRKQFGQRIGDFQLVQAMLADSQAELLARLGKHKTSVACLYFNKLDDIDPTVLRELAERSVATTRAKYPT